MTQIKNLFVSVCLLGFVCMGFANAKGNNGGSLEHTIKLSIKHNGHVHEPVLVVFGDREASLRMEGEEKLVINVKVIKGNANGPLLRLYLLSEVGEDQLKLSTMARDQSSFELASVGQKISLQVAVNEH